MMLVFLMTFAAKYLVEEYLLADIAATDYTTKHTCLYYSIIIGSFLTGAYYIVNNGRKFIDDSTRYV